MKNEIQGYPVDAGYMGFVDGKKMLFPTEGEYTEYMNERMRKMKLEEIEAKTTKSDNIKR